jgi:hypothetical protein
MEPYLVPQRVRLLPPLPRRKSATWSSKNQISYHMVGVRSYCLAFEILFLNWGPHPCFFCPAGPSRSKLYPGMYHNRSLGQTRHMDGKADTSPSSTHIALCAESCRSLLEKAGRGSLTARFLSPNSEEGNDDRAFGCLSESVEPIKSPGLFNSTLHNAQHVSS